jgi:hypothetical protein
MLLFGRYSVTVPPCVSRSKRWKSPSTPGTLALSAERWVVSALGKLAIRVDDRPRTLVGLGEEDCCRNLALQRVQEDDCRGCLDCFHNGCCHSPQVRQAALISPCDCVANLHSKIIALCVGCVKSPRHRVLAVFFFSHCLHPLYVMPHEFDDINT